MDKVFSIEIEVEENEKFSILEKLRGHFLKSGYIILRETNSMIDFYRPLPIKRKEEEMGYSWVNKVHIVAGENGIKVVCSLSKIKIVMFITILLAPIVEVSLAGLFYFLKMDLVVVMLFALSSLVTPIVAYFMFRYIYQQTIRFFADEIQRIAG